MRNFHALLLSLAAALAAADAPAQVLTKVNVSAPQINCVFSTSCTVTVNDLATPYLGNGFLQSRTFQALPGSPAAGKWVYEYRLDLRNAVGTTAVPLVASMALPVGGPIVAMDYNGDGSAGDQLFVVTGGGLGSVGPASAWLHGDTLHFTFTPPVQGGASPGAGQSTYFFGFVSTTAPTDLFARVEANVAEGTLLAVRAPSYGTGPSTVPDRSRIRVTPGHPRPTTPPVRPRP